jgi:glycosyltransferase involved in cell wall biosynthesis
MTETSKDSFSGEADLKGFRLVHTSTISFSLDVMVAPEAKYMVDKGMVVCGVATGGKHLESFAKKTGASVEAIEIKRAVTPFYDFVSFWNLWRFFRRFRPHIIHGHTPKGSMLGVVAGAFAGVPVRIHHIHGLPHFTAKGLKRFFLISSEKLASAMANQVYFVSPTLMRQAIAENICPLWKAKCFGKGSSGGVDSEVRFNPSRYDGTALRAELGIPAECVVIGNVGRIVRDKGIVELMTAFESLRDKYPHIRLLMVGIMEKKDSIPDQMKKRILEDDRIIFTGWQDEPAPYFKAMDILAFPSYREGFGAVAIQASAMGIPVVACDIPGCADAVANNETGLLVPPADAAALEAALETYIKDPALAKKHGENGRRRAISDFSPETIWKTQYGEYARLLKEKGLL